MVEDIRMSPWPVDVVEFGANAYAHRKQVDVKQLYNQVPQTAWVSQSVRVSSVPATVGVSWGQDARVRASSRLKAWALSDPRLSSPAKMRKKYRGTLGQYVAVCLRLQLTSHIQPTSTLSNKVWEVYFYKEVCSFVHWSPYIMLTMFPHIVVCGYTTIGQ